MLRIALIGDHNPSITAHRAIPLALARAGYDAGIDIEGTWIGTETLGAGAAARLATFDATWCVPGSPYADTAGALAAIRHARETGRPFLGTCAGFQHALLEYAEARWGIAHPAHAELDPSASDPVIAPLACGLVEVTGAVRPVPGTRLAGICGAEESIEGYHCNYGLSARHARLLESGPLRIAARDAAGEVRAVELDDHPFYFATLYQAERAALAGRSHPLIAAFVAAARHAGQNPGGAR